MALRPASEVVGTGTVAFIGGTVTNGATWQPGASPGVLAVEGNGPSLTADGVLDIEIGGSTPGTDFDQLAVTETANLSGTLRITLLNDFVPAEGDRFLIVPAASVTGSFVVLDLPDGLEAFVKATAAGAELVIGQPVANEGAAALPMAFALHPPYPNPFVASATVGFDVPEAGRVRLVVFDVLGREVAVLVEEEVAGGRHEVALSAAGLPSGVYVVRMTAGGFGETRRVTLLH